MFMLPIKNKKKKRKETEDCCPDVCDIYSPADWPLISKKIRSNDLT